MMAPRVYEPAYAVDARTLRLDPDSGDYLATDAYELFGQIRVSAAAIAQFAAAGRPIPAMVYSCSSPHSVVLRSHLRVAGVPAEIADTLPHEHARQAFTALIAGSTEALVCRRPLSGGPPIVGIKAVVVVRPTALREVWCTFCARLPADCIIIDLVHNGRRLGWPPGWTPEIVEAPAPEVLADPVLDRLALMPMRSLQAWAQGDDGRLALIARIRGYAPGWIHHSKEGWARREIQARTREAARPPP